MSEWLQILSGEAIGNRPWTWLLVPWVILVAATPVLTWRNRRLLGRFATPMMMRRLLPSTPGSTFANLATPLALTAAGLLIVAALDPRWGKTTREVPQRGIEVQFVLDVSKSMLAGDVTPDRLTRAKQQIKDMVDEMAGDRVGLVIFAGESKRQIPLTSHYDDFKQRLDQVGPASLRRGGSRLGDAIRVAANAFLDQTNDHKAIVVFTDGEDQESDPVGAARRASAERGIRIFTVGLGDIDQGSRIPVTDPENPQRSFGRFVKHNGEAVWTRMNGETLREVAAQSGGAFIPAGTRRVDMADVYHRYVATVEQTEFETATINARTLRFAWFAVPALVLIIIETFWRTRSPTRSQTRSRTK